MKVVVSYFDLAKPSLFFGVQYYGIILTDSTFHIFSKVDSLDDDNINTNKTLYLDFNHLRTGIVCVLFRLRPTLSKEKRRYYQGNLFY